MPLDTKALLILAVQSFSNFSKDNDPHGEHDFGSIELEAKRISGRWITTASTTAARKTRATRTNDARAHHYARRRVLTTPQKGGCHGGSTTNLTAYTVVKRENQDDFWLDIGAAFMHQDGEGFNVVLQALPINGKIVLRPPKARRTTSRRQQARESVRPLKSRRER